MTRSSWRSRHSRSKPALLIVVRREVAACLVDRTGGRQTCARKLLAVGVALSFGMRRAVRACLHAYVDLRSWMRSVRIAAEAEPGGKPFKRANGTPGPPLDSCSAPRIWFGLEAVTSSASDEGLRGHSTHAAYKFAIPNPQTRSLTARRLRSCHRWVPPRSRTLDETGLPTQRPETLPEYQLQYLRQTRSSGTVAAEARAPGI